MKFRLTVQMILVVLLSACANAPKHIVVSPELFGYNKGVYFDKSIKLNVVDQRPNTQVVQILKDGKAATLFSSQDSLANIITQALIPTFNKQGLKISQVGSTQVDVFINTALISVTQNFVDYHVNNKLALTATVSNNGQTISKIFSSQGRSHGPLNADMAVLERDFNHQLAALLINIANSSDIQNTINAVGESQNLSTTQ
jgi:uncharacterized lipoprotein